MSRLPLLFGIALFCAACSPRPSDTGDDTGSIDTGDDTADTDTDIDTDEPVDTSIDTDTDTDTGQADVFTGVVDLTGAARLVVLRPPERRVLEVQGELYKELEDGTQIRLFPEGWYVDQVAEGGATIEVRFSNRHWFDAADGIGGLHCTDVAFSVEDMSDPIRPLTCLLPTEAYALCGDEENPVPQCGHYGMGTIMDVAPDGVVWRLEVGNDFPPAAIVYAYTATQAIRVTPLTVLGGGSLRGQILVDGGILFSTDDDTLETYWLEPAGTASLKFLPDVTFPDPREWAGEPLLQTPDGFARPDAANRDIVPIPFTFDVEPTGRLYYPDVVNDRLYAADVDSGYYASHGYRCLPDLSCTLIPDEDPLWNLVSNGAEQVSDGEITWLHSGSERRFVHGHTMSDNLTGTIHVLDVRVIGGKLHFEGVNNDNVGGLFRVDYVDDAFVYTQVEEYTGDVVAIIPLAAP